MNDWPKVTQLGKDRARTRTKGTVSKSAAGPPSPHRDTPNFIQMYPHFTPMVAMSGEIFEEGEEEGEEERPRNLTLWLS